MNQIDNIFSILCLLKIEEQEGTVADLNALLDSFPAEVWNSKMKFLDPHCMTGFRLYGIYLKLMDSTNLINEFPDEQDRSNHILTNQVFGIAIDMLPCMLAQRTLYGYVNPDGNILCKDKSDRRNNIEFAKKRFEIDHFDIVIGQ